MEDNYKHLLLSAIHFLSYRIRSEKEVRDNLKKKGADREVIDKITEWLKQQKYIDDLEFARTWIRSRDNTRPKSQQVIRYELRNKGIPDDIINRAFEDKDNVLSDDLSRAKKLVSLKIKRYDGKSKDEIFRKLGSSLARNGFSYEIIKKSIDDVLENRL